MFLFTANWLLLCFFFQLIDCEFGHVGAAAFDLGTYIANLMISYYAHKLYPRDDTPQFYQQIKMAIEKSGIYVLKVAKFYLWVIILD